MTPEEKRREYAKKYYQANKEKMLARSKEYYKTYYKENKEKLNEYCKEYRKKHPEKLKAYIAANIERIRERGRLHAQKKREANPNMKREEGRKYRENNPEKYKAMMKKLYHDNVNGLSDYYVRRVLSDGTNLKPKEFTPEMVEIKRQIILINREVRNEKRNRTS